MSGHGSTTRLQLPPSHPFDTQRVKTLSFYHHSKAIGKSVMASVTSALQLTRRVGSRAEELRQSMRELQNSPCFSEWGG